MAYSLKLAGLTAQVDAVDLPDYEPHGLFMRHALELFNIPCSGLVVAMHGTLNKALEHVWHPAQPDCESLNEVSQINALRYRASDHRYALSKAYADNWEEKGGFAPQLVDPRQFVDRTVPAKPRKNWRAPPPRLIFAGRMERRKGPDLAIDLAWCLPKGSFSELLFIGPDHIDQGLGRATDNLRAIAKERNVRVRFQGPMSQADLFRLFEERSVLLLPSRYDTFNLVALEAFLRGCPVFVSDQTGFAQWLCETYPDLGQYVLNYSCSRSGVTDVARVLQNYDMERGQLVSSLKKHSPNWPSEPLDDLYTLNTPAFDTKARHELNDIFADLLHLLIVNFTSLDGEEATRDSVSAIVADLKSRAARPDLAPAHPPEERELGDISGEELLAKSPLFDQNAYCKAHPLVNFDVTSPIAHYIQNANRTGANPSSFFETTDYLSANPDVQIHKVNPLEHYLRHGYKEDRTVHPFFDEAWYRQSVMELEAAAQPPLEHLLAKRNQPELTGHPLFVRSWYAKQCADAGITVRGSFYVHYLEHGRKILLSPHPLFDAKWYSEINPDILMNGADPWHHFLTIGRVEGRRPHMLFDRFDLGKAADPNGFVLALFQTVADIFKEHEDNTSLREAIALLSKRPMSELLDNALQIAGACNKVPDSEFSAYLARHGENTPEEIRQKLKFYCDLLIPMQCGRAVTLRQMARLARGCGEDLLAVTYLLRVLRLNGHDRYGDLPYVLTVLREKGFEVEADAAYAMFDDRLAARDRTRAFLDDQKKQQMTKDHSPAAVVDKRCSMQKDPTVSVIVSMYNAETKLPTLLDNLALQTLAQVQKMEIVLVDSNSPAQERKVFERYAQTSDIPMVYVRSEERETIQKAWNRGITFAKGKYLCFLGCDEGIHPNCLTELSDYLNKNKSIDWVTANSIVTDVDEGGCFVKDVMTYDRTGYFHEITRFDTCYMNYVGGLYRKSIHDRFGYYDERFRGAGDTEFKMRLMRHLRSAALPKLLGVFNNYPEERTTQSPMAEIEDLRAWYIHRTTGGMDYGFNGKSEVELEAFFKQTLANRKSFCKHTSSDIELAYSIAVHWSSRQGSCPKAQKALHSASRLLKLLRKLDCEQPVHSSDMRWFKTGFEAGLRLALYAQEDTQTFGLGSVPPYLPWADNRSEQHAFPWYPAGA
ncbi:MAG: glycosyltransferase [Pseudomonadota bacterium]